jgi:hypothetical protein
MFNIRLLLIIAGLLISSSAIAGTILLMGIGLGTPGSSPPPTCSNKLDFSKACNSQYLTVF